MYDDKCMILALQISNFYKYTYMYPFTQYDFKVGMYVFLIWPILTLLQKYDIFPGDCSTGTRPEQKERLRQKFNTKGKETI